MQKLPFVSEEKLREITAVYPTPFHLYDEAGIRRTARALRSAFSWNDGFKEYFAVKACPNPFILKILKEEGCGVDCASMTELKLAEALGFSGDEIMFSSNETPAVEFEYARKLGAIINLDDITHIDFLRKHGGIPERICLRYNPGGELLIGSVYMGQPSGSKFGMTKQQIVHAVQHLMQLGVKEFGLHALLASNAADNNYYPANAMILFELAIELHQKLGAKIFMINLSGGVGIPYQPDQEMPDIQKIGRSIEESFDVMTSARLGDVSLSTELGRFMTGPHGCLVATAIHKKHIYKEYIGLDACAVNLMRPAMYDAYHHITVVGKEFDLCDHMYDVVGSLCENNDKFAVDRALPEIHDGDLIVIHDTGAHGYSMGYNYNGKLKSAEILLHPDGSFDMIRRAETIRDYFATFDFCDVLKDMKLD
ncbi:MAG: diaminopimelate decarboxylase [Clostridia bacterium]|nr:diaminopimelate decarboxylase [Clostridia bacterium]